MRECLGLRHATFRRSGRRISGEVFPLFEEFDGSLLYYPEIEPVTLDFRRVLSETRDKPSGLFDLNSRQFEEFIAEIWKRFGYCVELTARTRDGGRDIIAIRESEVNVRFLIECKRYARHRRVGVETVRELYGVKLDESATKAILATTSSFTTGARDLFRRHLWELEPRDYDGVVEWIKLATQTKSL